MTRVATAIAALCVVLLLPACGQDDGEPISQRRADRLESLLQRVQRQTDAGACTTLLDTTIPTLEREANRLPEGVGDDTRATIEDGVAHLRDLAETDCAQQQRDEPPETTETTEPTTETTEPPTTETTPTEPTTTETTEPEETTTETTPPDEGPGPEIDPGTGNGGTPPGQGGTPPGQEKDGKKDGEK